MKRLRVLPTLLLTALAVSLGMGSPAHSKGPTSAEVTGPGIDTTSLTYTEQRGDVDLNTMARATGIYGVVRARQFVADPKLSELELGPRYILTWHVGDTAMSTSHVYPFAVGGAWVYHPYDGGSWVRGGPRLERALVELGAVRPEPEVEPGTATRSTAVGSGSRAEVEPVASSSTGAGLAWLSGLAGLLALGGVTVWLLRRHTGTLSAWPLHRST